jgi:hypothetical protein
MSAVPGSFGNTSVDDILQTVEVVGKRIASYPNTLADDPTSNLTPSLPQSERLFTTRSRSVNYSGDGDRGQRAYIKVLTSDRTASMNRQGDGLNANPTSLGSTSGGVLNDAVNGTGGYTSFLLTDVSCNLEEKLQIIEVFGDAEVSYYFGRQPIMFNLAGIVVDSVDNNWFIEWLEMYTHVMRGTELARRYELIKLVLPNMTLIGTMTRLSWNQNAARDVDIPFQCTFMAKQVIPQPVTLPNAPLTSNSLLNLSGVQDFLGQVGINDIKTASANDQIGNLINTIQNPFSSVANYASALTGIGTGVAGSSSIVGDVLNPVSNLFNGITNDIQGTEAYLFGSVTSNLSGVRASLFSPVYGVLSSLTKLIATVGGVSSVLGSLSNPVRDILRDVTNISSQATSIVNLLQGNSFNGSATLASNSATLISTVATLHNTSGIITTQPASLTASILVLATSGRLSVTRGFLASKTAILSSGTPYTAEGAAIL